MLQELIPFFFCISFLLLLVHGKQEGCKHSELLNLFPPLLLIQLVSHWLSSTSSSQLLSSATELKEETPLLRYHGTRPVVSLSPLSGLVQWCVLEPLVPQETLNEFCSSKKKVKGKEEEEARVRVENYRSLVSKIHADLLSSLLSLATPSHSSVTTDDMAMMVASVIGLAREQELSSSSSSVVHEGALEAALDRLAQFLQIGLSVGVVSLHPGDKQ